MLAIVALATLQSGCGDTQAKGKGAADEQADDAAADVDPAIASAAADRKAPRRKKKSEKAKRAHIGEIPLDVWPEVWLKDPLSVAAEKGSTGGQAGGDVPNPDSPPVKNGADEAADKLAAATGADAKPGASDWTAVMSGEVLSDESKAIKTSLTDKLQSVGKYSGNYKELRIDATALAALANVAGEIPDAPSWKPNGRYIRDVASEVAKASASNGDKYYKPAREAFDKLDALLSGSKPPQLEESADKVKFSEVANRYYLMERMKRAYEWMKSNVNTEPIFKKESAKVSHEAAILAFLAKVIASPDYADADVDEYRGYAASVTKSGLDIEKAVKEQDFKSFSAALDRCYKACTDCHQNFKNN